MLDHALEKEGVINQQKLQVEKELSRALEVARDIFEM